MKAIKKMYYLQNLVFDARTEYKDEANRTSKKQDES